MKIGITGSNGFIGWHLRCYLKTRSDISEVRLASRNEFSSSVKLCQFVRELDCVVHLAGVNRAEPKELVEGNVMPAELLVQALITTNSAPVIIYSSSVQALNPEVSSYAEGKSTVTQIFSEWERKSQGKLINLIVPHVFGEYGRPHYNSAVATFAHQVANGVQPSIHNDGQLELVHVQDLVERITTLYEEGGSGVVRIEGHKTGVVEVAAKLQNLRNTYIDDGQIPDLSKAFERSLFNTLRGAFQNNMRLCKVKKHQDDRGWLVETVKANSGGQCFVSTTRPGITRGNHFHRRKVERFFVLQGKARIKLRKLFTDEVITYDLNGEAPAFVDIPTLHTHSITNIGDSELITLFWSDEFFDPDNSDTCFEEVVV
ncbi:MAG: NAD-dependent epimerase/dehydratase family protein [Gammaproteobacteria bacterium]|nr:NAD-dependent epimerase/dehydratase family protein [Gammaproteobacteria bacterium]